MLFALVDRAGLCIVVNLLVLYRFLARNVELMKWLIGSFYEGLNIFHRRLGEWIAILAFIYTIGMFSVWFTLLRPAHSTLLRIFV
jgi:hypothetical protein